jgi:hypothetical protein
MESAADSHERLDAGGDHRPTPVTDRRRRGRALVEAARRRPDGPAKPAAPSRDLFDEQRLPEISRNELTVDHVASGLLHHGALLVRGLLPPGHVQELRRFLDLGTTRLVQGAEATSDQAAMLDALVETYRETGLLALAESYIGEEPVGAPGRTVVKRNEEISGLPWHQDASFFRGKCGALNLWTALTPCGEQCPGLSVIPRRFETIVDPQHFTVKPSERAASVADELAREMGVASPVFEPGDALVLDEMTLHRTSTRRWKVPVRDVAITWFFAPSRFPAVYEPLAL